MLDGISAIQLILQGLVELSSGLVVKDLRTVNASSNVDFNPMVVGSNPLRNHEHLFSDGLLCLIAHIWRAVG